MSFKDPMNSKMQSRQADPHKLYRPHRLLRNGDLQTVLGRHIPQDARLVNEDEQMILFDAGPDRTGLQPGQTVKLLGFYTPGRNAAGSRLEPKGLVMLLHGWEGDSHSAYNLILGSALVREGFDVVRMNLRDHGPTHHLNRGLFFATLIEEVHAATQQAGLLAAGRPFSMVGASLGGSFVVRMALRHAQSPIPNLHRAIAVNPVLNPRRSCILLDNHRFLRRYFRSRWFESLSKKQQLFPELYDFSSLSSVPTVWEISDWVTKGMSPFSGVEEYLDAYSVKPSEFRSLAAPLTILTAANDPLIPSDDIAALPSHPHLRVYILPHGGHVGYNDLFPLRNCLPDLIRALLA
ncbi:MAG: alpha/beta fold hydrolase [Caldilineaceae bacterium SB0675_bin_29]|uniref:Alpha/beta fold hydrolase n=1 Tax=Caldilineaceae bacterium SB0675_bin_29 TaxID=2605266 RepID=A0A6B1G2I4_9CHLR|nr:alpha/beta fold hydrolase [Caldilineaceae bacterium SB0675_bin_29]